MGDRPRWGADYPLRHLPATATGGRSEHRLHGESGGRKSSFGYHEGRDVAAVLNLVRDRWEWDAVARSVAVRVLYVEDYPRWEFRYLRNLLQRDELWDVNRPLLESTGGFYRGAQNGTFPKDRETLLRELVGLVPAAWQFPELLEARITVANLVVSTPRFRAISQTAFTGVICPVMFT